ncbi:hypothetical protein N7481_004068 [Penicillium waksmanii]|uniref:uncharacterized protein n=1 Tax=Penicillium waksmanii TaxID=69791 RepID=UPI002547EEC1|nr:uncharacterized protein N7481_004068 [Penicillium waksmanii]KAJ5988858.1 hypothetical protein N7481_004068 [Penicillium waksmanii]
MSGLEVIGVIASIAQIADLELGATLRQDAQAKVCSEKAFKTAQEVLDECNIIFNRIDEAIEKENARSGKGRFQLRAQKLTIAFLGSDIDLLKSNLERLKSTMRLIPNVIMLAGQLRRTNDASVLGDQREMIQSLPKDKQESEAKYHDLTRSIQMVHINDRANLEDKGTAAMVTAAQSTDVPKFKTGAIFPGMSRADRVAMQKDLKSYRQLIQSFINYIDMCQSSLEDTRYLRIRNDVMNLHLVEIEEYRENQDPRVVQALERMVSTTQSPNYAVLQSYEEDDEEDDGEDEDGDEPELLKGSDSNPEKSQSRYCRLSLSLASHYPNLAESVNEEIIRGRPRNRSPPGLISAYRPGFVERQRTRSRSPRSRSRVNRKAPVAAAGLGTAAIAGLYERRKEQKPVFETVEELILYWTTLTVDEI